MEKATVTPVNKCRASATFEASWGRQNWQRPSPWTQGAGRESGGTREPAGPGVFLCSWRWGGGGQQLTVPRHGRGTRAPRKESFGAVGGGWMAAQRGQGLSIHKRPQQTSKWRENNVNQVSLCWRRKVQICKGRRPGRCWTGIRGTAVNAWLSIQLIRCRDTYGRMREARAYTHACASCLCPRRGPESSDTQGRDEGRQCPGLRL